MNTNSQNTLRLTAKLLCQAVRAARYYRTDYSAGMREGQKIVLASILQFALGRESRAFQLEIGAMIRQQLNAGGAQ